MPTPNVIKYSTATQSNALKKGNFYLGVSDLDYGPTVDTGFYSGITPPTGGYTLYLNKTSDGPSIYTATDDDQLIGLANSLYATNSTTATDVITYINGLSDALIVNKDYEPIVTDGLIWNLDAGFVSSYPRVGTSWIDLGEISKNATLVNGPTFSSLKGGSIFLDGLDDQINYPTITFTNQPFTLEFSGRMTGLLDTSNRRTIFTYEGDVGEFSNNVTLFNTFVCDSVVTYLNFGFSTAGSIVPDVDFYFAMSFNSSKQIMIYFNGKPISTPNTQLVNYTTITARYNRFGTRGGSRYYNGDVYNMRIYSKALSNSEVIQNYQSLLPRFTGYNIVTSGMVLYLDAGYNGSFTTSSNTWLDISGLGATGSLINGATFSSSDGGGITFDGANDYVTFGNRNLIQSDFTLNIWFILNTTSTKEHFILSNNYGTSPSLLITADSSINGISLSVYYQVDGSVTRYDLNSTILTNSQIYYLTLVRSEGINTPYINGVVQTSRIFTNSTVLGLSRFELGWATIRSKSTAYMQGNIYSTHIYNRALSSTEVLQNFNATKSRFGL